MCDYRKLSEKSFRARTGREWQEWCALLDEWGAQEKEQGPIARHILRQYQISPWWARAVALRYQWERGLRN